MNKILLTLLAFFSLSFSNTLLADDFNAAALTRLTTTLSELSKKLPDFYQADLSDQAFVSFAPGAREILTMHDFESTEEFTALVKRTYAAYISLYIKTGAGIDTIQQLTYRQEQRSEAESQRQLTPAEMESRAYQAHLEGQAHADKKLEVLTTTTQAPVSDQETVEPYMGQLELYMDQGIGW